MARPAKRKDGGAVPRNFIRHWRKRPGVHMTLAQVVERMADMGLPISEGHLSKLEKSEHPVDSRDIEGLAVVLQTSAIALMLGPPGHPLVRAIELLEPLSHDDQADAVDSLASWIASIQRRRAV